MNAQGSVVVFANLHGVKEHPPDINLKERGLQGRVERNRTLMLRENGATGIRKQNSAPRSVSFKNHRLEILLLAQLPRGKTRHDTDFEERAWRYHVAAAVGLFLGNVSIESFFCPLLQPVSELSN